MSNSIYAGLGHLAIQYAHNMGYRTVALSSSGGKEQLAKELGAHIYLDSSKVDQAEELQKLGGAKVIICTAPSEKIIPGLLNGLRTEGTLLILAGMYCFSETSRQRWRADKLLT